MAEGRGMTTSTPKAVKEPRGLDPWEVRDAMHTVLRSSKIIKDKKLMAAVKKEAKSYAKENAETAAQAQMLAMMGRISPKQMAKLGR